MATIFLMKPVFFYCFVWKKLISLKYLNQFKISAKALYSSYLIAALKGVAIKFKQTYYCLQPKLLSQAASVASSAIFKDATAFFSSILRI